MTIKLILDIFTLLHFYEFAKNRIMYNLKGMFKMTISKFVEHYSNESLFSNPLGVKTTALRSYIKENREKLEAEGLVKFTKKLRSINIEIINPEGLFAKLA